MLTKRLAIAPCLSAMLIGGAAIATDAQSNQPGRPAARPTPTPRVLSSEAIIISRAEDLEYETSPRGAERQDPIAGPQQDAADRTIESLENRLRVLEENKPKDPDAVQRRLMMNLDILTRAEQRADVLRKQMFDLFEKETTILSRLDALDIEGREDMIERSVATMGSLRPEELRAAKRRQIEAERSNLQRLLGEIQRNRTMLEASVQKADELVDRLRLRLEKEIDDALVEQPTEQP